MKQQVRDGGFDAIVHSAAISDYLAGRRLRPRRRHALLPRRRRLDRPRRRAGPSRRPRRRQGQERRAGAVAAAGAGAQADRPRPRRLGLPRRPRQVQAGSRPGRETAPGARRVVARLFRRQPDGRQHPGRRGLPRLPRPAGRRLPVRPPRRPARPPPRRPGSPHHGERSMANVLLGVTGSVAALKTPIFDGRLKRSATRSRSSPRRRRSTSSTPPPSTRSTRPGRNATPPSSSSTRTNGRAATTAAAIERGDDVLHIELRRWADLLLIAPLDANTLGKLAAGLADNCLTCVWRAWDPDRPVVLAPAMNTLMWRHPLTGPLSAPDRPRRRRPAGPAGAARGRPRRLDQRPLPPAARGRAGEPPAGLRRRGRRRPGRPGRRRRSRSVPSR